MPDESAEILKAILRASEQRIFTPLCPYQEAALRDVLARLERAEEGMRILVDSACHDTGNGGEWNWHNGITGNHHATKEECVAETVATIDAAMEGVGE